MVVRAEQERVRLLLKEAIPMLCKNGLSFTKEFCIEALVGITLDEDNVFLVSIKETVKNDFTDSDTDTSRIGEQTLEVSVTKQTSASSPKSGNTSNRKRQRSRKMNKPPQTVHLESGSDDDWDAAPEGAVPAKQGRTFIENCLTKQKSNKSLTDELEQYSTKHSTISQFKTIPSFFDDEDIIEDNIEDSVSVSIVKCEPNADMYATDINISDVTSSVLESNTNKSNCVFESAGSDLPYAQGSANKIFTSETTPYIVQVMPNVTCTETKQEPPIEEQFSGEMYHTDDRVTPVDNNKTELGSSDDTLESSLTTETHNNLPMSSDCSTTICNVCQKQFSRNDSLKRHLLIHTNSLYKCSICNRAFYQKSHLVTHIANGHGDHRKKLKCETCDKEYCSSSGFTAHVRSHYGIFCYMCSQCGKGFNYKSSYDAHIAIHTGEKKFKCFNCSKAFSCQSYFSRHKQICGNSKKKYNCHICMKEFSAERYLKSHIQLLHINPGRFQCQVMYCGRVFNSASSLSRHRKIHKK